MTIHPTVTDTRPHPSWRGACLTIGNFDGVHRGHRQLLEALRTMAARHGGPSIVMTFYPHPAEVLSGKKPQRLMPIEDRVRMLLAHGADGVWVVPFTPDYATITAEGFVEETLVNELAVRGLVVGPDARFGAERAGDSRLLATYEKRGAFELVVVEPHVHDGVRISSSEIRRLLRDGAVGRAAAMLGRPYRMKGTVVRGMQMGSKLGFPTANLSLAEDVLVPANGIYVVRVRLGDDPASAHPYQGVANVGHRPSVDNGPLAVEAHLFEATGDFYGQPITIEFLRRVRAEAKYDSLDRLKVAIADDVRAAREFFNGPASQRDGEGSGA